MDSTPASHRSRTKLVSRLARLGGLEIEAQESPKLSLDLINSPSPRKIPSPSSISVRSSNNSLPFQELLLLSPSPYKRSKTRLADRLEMAADEAAEPTGHRKRCKSRGSHLALSGCGSPRTNRRSRRRPEAEAREERDPGYADEMGKPRRRRNSGRSKKEKLTLVPLITTSSSLSSMTFRPFQISSLNFLSLIIQQLRMIYLVIRWS